MDAENLLRLDVALPTRGLCPSRERAQSLIRAGLVAVNGRPCAKPSTKISENDSVELLGTDHPYVSRGGLKLEKAIRSFGADLTGKVCMDIGAATGGFTDVCLQSGARHVYAIDVGYGQFDWKLRNDPRVTVMERTNARYLTQEQVPLHPTVTVMDVSFISIRLILPVAAGIMGDEGVFYTLIKPQFEAGRDRVGKKGVVRDLKVHEDVLREIVDFVPTFGWQVQALDYSPITGPEGNIEFLAKITKKRSDAEPCSPDVIRELVSRAHDEMKK